MFSVMFLLVRIAPGDPSLKLINPKMNKYHAKQIEESYKLKENLLEQYTAYIVNTMSGNLGISYNHRKPVTDVIFDYLPFTLMFTGISFIFQLSVCLFLIWFIHTRLHGFWDNFFSSLSLYFYITPVFVTGVLMVFIFSVLLGLFPSSGTSDLFLSTSNPFVILADKIHHLILPIVTISLVEIAIYYKYLRASIEKTMTETFVVYQKRKGLSKARLFFSHILPNSIDSLIAVAGFEIGVLLGGTLIVEVIFGLPGMGRLTVSAIASRDYPLILGCTIFSGVFILIANFIADLIRGLIDKRKLRTLLN